MKKARAALAAAVGLTLSATGALAASSAISTLAQDHAAVGGPKRRAQARSRGSTGK